MDSYNLSELKNIAKQVNIKIRAEHKENVKKAMKIKRTAQKKAISKIKETDAETNKKMKNKFSELLKKKLIPIAKQSKTSLKGHLAKHPEKTSGLKPLKKDIDDLPLPPMPKEKKLSAAEEAEMKKTFEEAKKTPLQAKKEIHTFKKGGKFFKVKAKKEEPKTPKITITEHKEKNEGGKADVKSQLPKLKEKAMKLRVAQKKKEKKKAFTITPPGGGKKTQLYFKEGKEVKKKETGYKGKIPTIKISDQDKIDEGKKKAKESKERTENKLKQREEKKKGRKKFDPAAALRKVIMRKVEFDELKRKVKVADMPKEDKERYSKLLQKRQEDELDDEHVEEMKEIVKKYEKKAVPEPAPAPAAKAEIKKKAIKAPKPKAAPKAGKHTQKQINEIMADSMINSILSTLESFDLPTTDYYQYIGDSINDAEQKVIDLGYNGGRYASGSLDKQGDIFMKKGLKGTEILVRKFFDKEINKEEKAKKEKAKKEKEIKKKAKAKAKPAPKKSRYIKPFDKSPEIKKLVDKIMPEDLFSKEDQKEQYEGYKEMYDEIEDGKIEDPDDLDLDEDEMKLWKLLFPKIKRLEEIKKEKEKIKQEIKEKNLKDEKEYARELAKLKKKGTI